MMPSANVAEAAAWCAALGIKVLPLYGIVRKQCACGDPDCENPGKHPDGRLVPHGVDDASCDPDQIERWFAHPNLNLGIALGSDYVVIDEDKAGALVGLGIDIPNCPCVRTGRPGRHYWFAAPNGAGAALANGPFAPGLEAKTGAAYVVAPPSTHASGRPYVWVRALDEVVPPELPQAIADLIVAAHAGKGNGAAKDDLHTLFGTLKLEKVFLELETLRKGDGARWRDLMLRAVRSLVGKGLPTDLIAITMRRATRRDLGYTHEQTDSWVLEEVARVRKKDGRPEPSPTKSATGASGPTFNQVDEPQGEAWPEPLDILGAPELTGWPELTNDCLPALLYRYVEVEAERLGVDPCPLAAHVIAACAASISDAWRIKPKQHDRWTQQPRIWSCVVKDVGARGTDMIRSAFWPLRERDRKLFADWRREHTAWEQREAGRKKPDPSDPEPRCRRITSSDITVEKASEILAQGDNHAKLALVCDELAGFLGGFGRYTAGGASVRAQWLESYDGGPQWIDRIKRGSIYVANWSIVAAGNIQPRRLAAMAKELVVDGLFQRFLTVHARPNGGDDDDDLPLPVDAGRDYRALHETLAQMQPVRGVDGELKPAWFDDDARAIRQSFRPLIKRLRLDPSLPVMIRETAPKWEGLLARISLIYHLAELANQIRQGSQPEPRELCQVSGPTVTSAATFIRRIVLPNLFRLGFDAVPDHGAPETHARWLAGHILAQQLDKLTAYEIGRACHPLRGKSAEITGTMDILCHAGWASPADPRQHNSTQWAINPAVHTLFAKAAAAEKIRRAQTINAIRTKVTEL
jgi:hypothetical protein